MCLTAAGARANHRPEPVSSILELAPPHFWALKPACVCSISADACAPYVCMQAVRKVLPAMRSAASVATSVTCDQGPGMGAALVQEVLLVVEFGRTGEH